MYAQKRQGRGVGAAEWRTCGEREREGRSNDYRLSPSKREREECRVGGGSLPAAPRVGRAGAILVNLSGGPVRPMSPQSINKHRGFRGWLPNWRDQRVELIGVVSAQLRR